jgi:zinc/manganese transport system ATP-binding protein
LRRRDIAYLPQLAEIDRSFPISIGDTVLLGGWRSTGAFGGVSRGLRDQAAAALAAVGLEGLEDRPIARLSAGQFQRALFARLLVQDARLILLDEPFAAVDAGTTRDLTGIIRRWHGEGRTVITVLHDLEQVRTHCPATLLMARQLVDWGPTATVLQPDNLGRARALSEHWSDSAEPCLRSVA